MPQHNKLTSFPVAYCQNFKDVTIPLMKLGQRVRCTEIESSGNHGYIGTVSPYYKDTPQTDSGAPLNIGEAYSEYEDNDEIIYIGKDTPSKKYYLCLKK